MDLDNGLPLAQCWSICEEPLLADLLFPFLGSGFQSPYRRLTSISSARSGSSGKIPIEVSRKRQGMNCKCRAAIEAPECKRTDALCRGLVCIVVGISFLICVGCYPVPVRFPTRTADMSGGSIDLNFLKAGATTRDQVNSKLASVDTGTKQGAFFGGRMRVSKYRLILMVGYVPVGPLGESRTSSSGATSGELSR